MTATQVVVGLGEIQILQGDALFSCIGLGSCIATIVADHEARLYGVAHVMLPEPLGEEKPERPGKFAPTAVKHLVERLVALGANPDRMKAAIAGGAQVIQGSHTHLAFQVGARNGQAVRKALAENGVPVMGEDVGGHVGRNVSFDTSTGKVSVRMTGNPEVSLCVLR